MEQALAQLDVKILFDDFTYHANISSYEGQNLLPAIFFKIHVFAYVALFSTQL